MVGLRPPHGLPSDALRAMMPAARLFCDVGANSSESVKMVAHGEDGVPPWVRINIKDLARRALDLLHHKL